MANREIAVFISEMAVLISEVLPLQAGTEGIDAVLDFIHTAVEDRVAHMSQKEEDNDN